MEPQPHRLRGVNPRFRTFDPADLTEFLRSHLSPEVEWEPFEIQTHGTDLGVVYVHQSFRRPIICRANSGNHLKAGEVYYRYRGQSTRIEYSELQALINDRIKEERLAWMKHLEAISRAGPRNVGILDTTSGKVEGEGGSFLIEADLLDQLKFIRQGHFSEVKGEPTLRLIGELSPVGGVVARKPEPVAIQRDDLTKAMLGSADLSADAARQYLRAAAYQSSKYTPVFYFAKKAQVSRPEAVGILKDARSAYEITRESLVARLEGEPGPGPSGTILQEIPFDPTTSLSEVVESSASPAQKRTAVLRALRENPQEVVRNAVQLPPLRLSEAVTHLSREDDRSTLEAACEALLAVYDESLEDAGPGAGTAFRKAVVHLDRVLYDKAEPGGESSEP